MPTAAELKSIREYGYGMRKLADVLKNSPWTPARGRTTVPLGTVRDEVEHPKPSESKAMPRGHHLEFLVFEICSVIDLLLGKLEATDIFESSEYAELRTLYKALAHRRRPDGSKY